MNAHLTDISQVIQLAVAPVFLLTALATLISALNARLGRIVDRRRVVLDRMQLASSSETLPADDEITSLAKRSRMIYLAIFCVVLAALLICLVVAGAFMGALFGVDLARLVAGLFIGAMLAMVCGLSLFLREVFLAVQTGNHYRQ